MEESEFKTVIKSRRRLLDLHLGDLWCYRDLVILFVKRNFIANYKQTVLGPAWAVLQPLLTTVVFTIVFGNFAKLSTADTPGESREIPGFLFYMAGTICWSCFAAIVSNVSGSFISNIRLLSKVWFPRLVVPVSGAMSRLLSFGIQLALLFCFWTYYYTVYGNGGIRVSASLLLLLPAVVQMIVLAMGAGMVISSLTTKYRDLTLVVDFGLQLWQYGSPVVYGLSIVPERYLTWYMLNPMVPVLTTFRYALFGEGFFSLPYYMAGWGLTLILFFVGLLLFNKAEKDFVDTV